MKNIKKEIQRKTLKENKKGYLENEEHKERNIERI